jgi:LytS/YehU family sensor histidine kinase
LWALFWLLLMLIAIQDNRHDSRWWAPILSEGSSAVFGTLWLNQRRRVVRSFDQYLDRPLYWIGHQLKWVPVWAVIFVAAVYSFRHGVYALLGQTYHHDSWGSVFVYETLKLGLFMGLWLGILFGFESFGQLQVERERSLAIQAMLAEAQLSQLKAQLQPHFLFNTLNTISSLMFTDVAQADRLLARLGDLLRSSLLAGKQSFATLREELRILELYARIMQERFGDRAVMLWEVDERSANARVPCLLLQPLLENAFKHGVELSRRKETVRVAARRIGHQLHVTIHNTGSSLSTMRSDGIGVRNCRERLRVLYGAEGSLDLATDSTGVEAHIVIPYSEQLS